MKLTTEPSVDIKVLRMKERVRWQQAPLVQRGIDQTRLVVEDDASGRDGGFSFLVLGDSGTGRHRSSSPQRQVAQQLMTCSEAASFVIHTGDVVYLVGSSEQYRENFIKPYREWLANSEHYRHLAYDQMVFKLPFFPVLGNHDYYDLPPLLGLLAGITNPLRYLLRSYVDLDVSWHGSFQGDAYARAFLDYLRAVPGFRLAHHLDKHYTSTLDGARCLTYRPGEYTRLPNRYYSFRYGGIDFFALDSNTFNLPLPLPDTLEGRQNRQRLEAQRQRLEAKKNELLKQGSLNLMTPMNEEDQADITEEMEQIDEQLYDIDKQLSAAPAPIVDLDQLHWLRDRLIASWENPAVRGRIIWLHHPPYVTEATKWYQGQTLAVRRHLRQVLDDVAAAVGQQTQGQPLVNLVLSGHAHCMEYLQTGNTGHADAHLPWIICGGSGYSLRRQRPEGPDLPETLTSGEQIVATSKLFLGRTGHGSGLKRPYSGLRIDVDGGSPPRISVTPMVAEKSSGKWHRYSLESFQI